MRSFGSVVARGALLVGCVALLFACESTESGGTEDGGVVADATLDAGSGDGSGTDVISMPDATVTEDAISVPDVPAPDAAEPPPSSSSVSATSPSASTPG